MRFLAYICQNSNNFIIFATRMKDKLYIERRRHIGRLLQSERKHLHLEQVDIARVFGVRQELISKIEAGSRRIDILELMDYCEALNFTLTEFAWKLETYLSALSLLQLPKRNIFGKKIKVDVSWCENKFLVSFGEIVPDTFVFTADTFVGLQKAIEDGLNRHIKEIAADGFEIPLWLVNKEYEFDFRFHDAVSLLKAYCPYVSLAAISRVSGINQNLLSQYANGLKKARPKQIKRIMEAIHIIGRQLMSAVV